MENFSRLPRYPFTHAMVEHAPEGCGVYGLFEGDELIYIGRATRGMSSKAGLAMQLGGFGKAHGREPRCQGKTVR